MENMPAHQSSDALASVKRRLTDAAKVVATVVMNWKIRFVSIVETGQAVQLDIFPALIPRSEPGNGWSDIHGAATPAMAMRCVGIPDATIQDHGLGVPGAELRPGPA